MELKEYIELAVRTESVPTELNIDREAVALAMNLFVESGKLLDGLKRSIYYKNDERLNANFEKHISTIIHLIQNLNEIGFHRISNSWDRDCGLPAEMFKSEENAANVNPRVFHGIIGIATEAVELMEAMVPSVLDQTVSIDAVNLQEEMGDGAGGSNSWYAAILHDALGLDPHETMVKNINKLRKRYPDKYNDHHAVNRDLDSERQILETDSNDPDVAIKFTASLFSGLSSK